LRAEVLILCLSSDVVEESFETEGFEPKFVVSRSLAAAVIEGGAAEASASSSAEASSSSSAEPSSSKRQKLNGTSQLHRNSQIILCVSQILCLSETRTSIGAYGPHFLEEHKVRIRSLPLRDVRSKWWDSAEVSLEKQKAYCLVGSCTDDMTFRDYHQTGVCTSSFLFASRSHSFFLRLRESNPTFA
jgi:hypothetical protein